ncbi:MAG: hypothetical protein KUG83_07015 [Gammaproteobacteria bacterium]|nr:hypothetical protein [Gammaproteobacteria bacterium]
MIQKYNFFSPNATKHWERRRASVSLNYRHLGYEPRRGLSATKGSHKNSYVDWYSADMLLVTILLSLLSIFDSLITQQLLMLGGSEENHIMAIAIERGYGFFMTTKFSLTSLGIIFLVIHKNFVIFKAFRVEQFLYFLLFAYSALLIWETHLLNIAMAASF